MTFIDENRRYSINCDKAIWATNDEHDVYEKCTLSVLRDTDWIIETHSVIIMVEYKNGLFSTSDIPFNPSDDNYIDLIAHKYYDSLHYLALLQKIKPIKYVYIVEYPISEIVSRKMLRDKIARKLPFKLQKKLSNGIKLIESFEVISINEWNEMYPDFPLTKIDNDT